MTLTSTVKQAFDARVIVPFLYAVGAFLASRFGGMWLQKYHPLLRYAPGVLLIGTGLAWMRREGGKSTGIGVVSGAGLDLALYGAERAGLLAKLQPK